MNRPQAHGLTKSVQLAVTTKLETSVVMCGAVIFVLAGSNFAVHHRVLHLGAARLEARPGGGRIDMGRGHDARQPRAFRLRANENLFSVHMGCDIVLVTVDRAQSEEDGSMAKSALAFQEIQPPEEVFYPESDGEPMAETDEHRDELAEIIFTLKRHFRDRPDVYVSGNLFLYYEEGNPKRNRAPDVFVVIGVPNHQRRNYRLWEEGRPPVMAIELTSKSTKDEDKEVKPPIYAALGIDYLFQYDVLGDYQKPPLKGRRLGGDGQYHPLVGGARGPFPCPPLGLDLVLDEDGRLQFVDRKTGESVVRERVALDQSLEALRLAEQALEEETEARRREAEARRQAEQRAEEQAEARRQEAEARRRAERRAEEQAKARRLAERRAEEQAEALRQAEDAGKEMRAVIERLQAQLRERADDRDEIVPPTAP